MGFYLDLPESHQKALQLKRDHEAQLIHAPQRFADVPAGKTLIAVVVNPEFDAAGIIFDQQEMDRCINGTRDREVTWLLLDTERVVSLKPHLATYLRGERDWRE